MQMNKIAYSFDSHRIADEIIKKERLQGPISIQNLITKILKNLKKYEEVNKKDENDPEVKEILFEIQNEIYSILSNLILSQFPNGVQDLIDADEPDICVVLNFQGPTGFYKKMILHEKFSLKNEEVDTHEIIIKTEEFNQETIISRKKDIKVKELMQELIERKKQTVEYIKIIISTYCEFDKYERTLLDKIIQQTAEIKSKKFKEIEKNKFNFLKENENLLNELNQIGIEHSLIQEIYDKCLFFEFKYEDYLLLMVRIMHFFTNFSFKVTIDELDDVYLKISGNDKAIAHIAEEQKLFLQMKPYAHHYDKLSKKLDVNFENEEEVNLVFNNSESDPNNTFVDHENYFNFPPYMLFTYEKREKFRRYLKNDIPHNCPYDPDFSGIQLNPDMKIDCCRQFRTIERLRVINHSFEDKILIYMRKFGRLKQTFLVRNVEDYELENRHILWSQANIFDEVNQKGFINTVRNFYGEKFSFLFLFKWYFLLWLIFPTLLGIIIGIILQYFQIQMLLKVHTIILFRKFVKSPYIFRDFVYFIHCFLNVLWAVFLLKFWKNHEKMYAYFWGVENANSIERVRDEFIADGHSELIFDIKYPYQSTYKKVLKIILAYSISFFFVYLGFLMIKYVNHWEVSRIIELREKSNNKKAFDYFYPIFVGVIYAAQMELFNFLYAYFAIFMTNWENHEKQSQYDNSFTLKEVVFKTLNGFSSLIYVAFIKQRDGGCQKANCFEEVGIQLYLNLIMFMFVRLAIFGIRSLIYIWRRRWIRNSFSQPEIISFNINSIYHLKAVDTFEVVIVTYTDILILFGKVIFFSVTAPFSPLLLMIILYFFKFFENYLLFYRTSTMKIYQVKGMGIHFKMFIFYCFIGTIISISLILFTNPHLKSTSLISRFIILAAFENFILIFLYFSNFNVLPKWFEHVEIIKSLYYTKYYSQVYDSLPHHELSSKAKHIDILNLITQNNQSDDNVNKQIIVLNQNENEPFIEDKDVNVVTTERKNQ